MRLRSMLLFAAVCLSAVSFAQTKNQQVLVQNQAIVTFSATPTFNANLANAFKLTLTGNVTSSTLSNADAGQPLQFEICQDATGGRTFAPPSNVSGWVTIPSTASTCVIEFYLFDGTNAVPDLTAPSAVSAVNGVSFPASPSTHSVPVVTAANTITYKVIPDCQDTVGDHINYTQSSDSFSCGTTVKPLTPSFQKFTTSGTFTIPAVNAVKVTVVGGGAAGGGASVSNTGAGGGSGGVAYKWLSGLTPGNTLTVTVGAGGTGVSNATGNNGSASTVASGTQTIATITANGGVGGQASTNPGPGSGALISTGGDINGAGAPGIFINTASTFGGAGGSTFLGGGAPNVPGSSVGQAAIANTGGGGSGAGIGATNAGGAGAAGIVIFEWVQ